MAGRSQLPAPKRSTRQVSSVVRTVVEPPEEPCPAMSRLPCPSGIRPPRASGLRPPCSYGSPAAAPAAPAPCSPRPSGLRSPQVRSGIRPPQASGLRPPRPVSRLPQRGRSPCAPPPCAPAPAPCAPPPPPCAPPPPPCEPEPCPAAAAQEEQYAAMQAAVCAQRGALDALPQETPEEQQERRAAAIRRQQIARVRELALAELQYISSRNAQLLCEFQDACRNYNMTREAVAAMLMEKYDISLRIKHERMLRREARNVCNREQWRGVLALYDFMRSEMLHNYRPYAEYTAQFFANHELWQKRWKRLRQRLRLRRPPLGALEESQVDVFDDSPPPCGPEPMLPERVFDISMSSPSLSLIDSSPPCDIDLPPPLLGSYTSPTCPAADDSGEDDWYLEFDTLRDPRRQLVFDSEDDDSLLEGAVGGAYM